MKSHTFSRDLRVYECDNGSSAEACVLWMIGHAGDSSAKEGRRIFRVGYHSSACALRNLRTVTSESERVHSAFS
jgi:hypothetical protein